MSVLVSLHAEAGERDDEIARLGQKGAWLRWLVAQGERVPQGFVIPADVAPHLRARDAEYIADLRQALQGLAGKGAAFAVRASPILSLPGALLTVLDVPFDQASSDVAPVLAAIERVLNSVSEPAVRAQLSARGLDPGTEPWLAVVVQKMVRVQDAHDFGAVALTHDPAYGEPGLVGEYAPGEPTSVVVSGRARPLPMTRAMTRPGREAGCLEVTEPEAFAQLRELCTRLTVCAEEPLELELVMTQGTLWIVQARPLVLSARGSLRVALDALRAQSASALRLLRKISPADLSLLVESRLPDPSELAHTQVVARGLAASPGVASGRLVFDLDEAITRAAQEPIVLVRRDALPEDIAAFRASRAVVTTSGGLTSHAAVIARGLRIPAAIGCAKVRLDGKLRALVRTSELASGEIVAREGDLVTVDGHRGLVYAGIVPSVPVVAPELRALCLELRPRRTRLLFALGPSIAADRAYEECALDGVWDAESNTHVRGSAPTEPVQVVNDLAADSSPSGHLQRVSIACPPEQAVRWALWLALQGK